MKDQKDIKKVYLLNQNYSHGQQVAKYAKEDLKRKRPDIEIVGEDLHPLGAGARLRALHRQDQGLGRRHGDHRQLGLRPVAAGQGGAVEGGYNGKFFTYYAGVTGTPTALGTQRRRQGLPDRLCRTSNMGGADRQWTSRSSRRSTTTTSTPARSSACCEVAEPGDGEGQVDRSGQGGAAMEGSEVQERASAATSRCARPTTSCSSRCTSAVWQKADAKNPYSLENTGMTFAPVAEYPTYVSSTPTSCQMKRPSAP